MEKVRSYETDQYYGQFPLDGCGSFFAAEALTPSLRRLKTALTEADQVWITSKPYDNYVC
ncbi:MAG: hypothetical protein GY801_53280 [bacterium]|nr:hypothetical protein [bacterium]